MASEQKILLIEDDREIASTISGALDAAGYNVVLAQNGIEGRQLVETENPQLVITDMMMPRMGGFPILEFLKSLDDPPRVIMITANEGGRHKAYAEMLGVADYIRKPFAIDVLLKSVRQIFSEKSAASAKAATKSTTAKKAAKKKAKPKKTTRKKKSS